MRGVGAGENALTTEVGDILKTTVKRAVPRGKQLASAQVNWQSKPKTPREGAKEETKQTKEGRLKECGK